jgi:hypothetical protein
MITLVASADAVTIAGIPILLVIAWLASVIFAGLVKKERIPRRHG